MGSPKLMRILDPADLFGSRAAAKQAAASEADRQAYVAQQQELLAANKAQLSNSNTLSGANVDSGVANVVTGADVSVESNLDALVKKRKSATAGTSLGVV